MPVFNTGWNNASSRTPQQSIQQPQQGWTDSPVNPIQTTPTPYTPTYDTSSAIGKLIDSIGKNLKPMDAFSTNTPYETYAAPQRAAFDWWNQNTFRPEFERTTMNPFENQYANQAAAGNYQQMGGGQQQYQMAKEQTEKPYYDQLEQARGSWENMMRQGYNQRMERSYDSPIAFSNFQQQ